MKIHEYQAKEILKGYGVAIPKGIACFSVDEAVSAAEKIGGTVWVVKAQIHAGGRGKGGGVKIAKSIEEVRAHAQAILGMTLVTPQTGPEGKLVKRLFVEEGAHITHEYYVGMVVDRETQKPCLIASSEGGMEIEDVAKDHPEKIHKVFIDYAQGLTEESARALSKQLNIPSASTDRMVTILQSLARAFWALDASLLEINPLALLASGDVVALDAKVNFDSNALFRHEEIMQLRDLDEEDPLEIEASAHQLSYISLSGNIGCLVNGAGLAMATMDMVKLFGGSPANFLDVGGGASVEKIVASFQIMLKNPAVKVLFVNVFGGILHCSVVAQGLIDAAKTLQLNLPIVARLVGTNEQKAKELLSASDVNIIVKDTMAEAAKTSVELAHSMGA